MKIAMIGHKTVPSRDGGVEVAVEALAVRMAAQGHDVTLYNRGRRISSGMPSAAAAEQLRNVHIRQVPVIARGGAAAFTGSLLAALHTLFCRYDCVHLHAEGPAAMALLTHARGIRTVVTIHGLDWKRSKWGRFASWYLRQGERCAARYADEIIVLSRAAQTYFRETYGRETVYIPNGVEAPVIREASLITEQFGLKKDSYILYLGRIVPEKGLARLIEAFSGVKTDKKLVIAGSCADSGAHYEMLRRMAANDGRVLFTGFAEGQLLEELYSNSYIYCLPSELEGMPISLLEAMRYGNCCLVSDIAECTEVLGGCGYAANARDTDALREMLQRLCDDPAAVARSRERLAAFAFGNHDWDAVTAQTLALYRGDAEK